jgi:ectoine hydroxylase-related dioxygenase (phytanoyl-CoA dioxygenase family)
VGKQVQWIKGMDIFDSGWQIERSVLSVTECDSLLASFSGSPGQRGRAGTRHMMSQRAVSELANDGRLLQIARRALSAPAVPFRATLFAKSGDVNWLIPWHQDTALPLATRFDDSEWSSWSEKGGICYAHAPSWALSRVVALRVHLDASTGDNGPLRVVPGSHRAGVLTDADVSDYVSSHEHTTCLVPRGGILLMRPLLIHSSSKAQADTPRRVLHIEYSNSLDLKPAFGWPWLELQKGKQI